ncbi:YbjN domain-containing protein [Consotaella aegiceratis]|uniref:YbjN domain-containing protein n=1 Tax=Consotaella aegiceratis TaxID=3097961 RepID=UPI002F405729
MRTVLTLPLLLMLAGPLDAADLIQTADLDQIANMARGYGSATVTSGEDAYVRGRIDGTLYAIFPEDCDDGACKSVRFYAAWSDVSVDPETINAWNRERRFSKAYIDEAGDPVLEMDVNLRYGVTIASFDDSLDWWSIGLGAFVTEVLASEGNSDQGDDVHLLDL